MCPEFAGSALRGLKQRRFRPENAHLRLPDRRKPTGAAGKGKFRSKSQKKPPNQRFPRERNNARDLEMPRNRRHFGMKLRIGTDPRGLVCHLEGTAANVAT